MAAEELGGGLRPPSEASPLDCASGARARTGTEAALALLAGAVVVVGMLAWRSRGWPLVHDAPIMHYIAWRIGEGAVPYRDLFDMNFPGTYLVHLAVLRLLGAGDVAWRVFDLAWLGASSVLVAALAAPWGRVGAALAALLFAAYHLAGGAWQAGQRDFLLCAFLLGAALGVAGWAEGRRPLALTLAGLALGAGVTVKPHAVAFAAALAAVVLVTARRGGAGWAPLGIFAGGVAVVPVLVAAWLAANGALAAWRDIVVGYLIPLYSRLGREADWWYFRWHLWVPLAAAVVLSLGATVARGRFGVRHAVAVLGIAYGVVHFLGQGKGWEYHLYPLAAFAAVVAVAELEPLLAARRRLAALSLAVSLGAVIVLLGQKGAEAVDAGWVRDKERRVAAVTADVGARLADGETVQVLDTTEGGVHALLRLGRREPSRFIYDFHFFHDPASPVVTQLRAELLRDLDARPPRLIVVFERGWPDGGYDRVERFPALARRLSERYRAAAHGDGYTVYAQRDDS